jgi:hypothetical protein
MTVERTDRRSLWVGPASPKSHETRGECRGAGSGRRGARGSAVLRFRFLGSTWTQLDSLVPGELLAIFEGLRYRAMASNGWVS